MFGEFEEPEGVLLLFVELGILDRINDNFFLNFDNELVKNELKNQDLIEEFIVKKLGDNLVKID